MKKNIFIFALIATFGLTSCSNDDDNTPEVVNEEEVITTVTLTLVPSGGGDTVILISNDVDGDGPAPPVTAQTGDFVADTDYTGLVSFTNVTETPAEDITEEVIAEAEEHQVFYISSGSLNLTTSYNDTDSDGNPLGVMTTVMTGAASSGTLNIVLRHEPNKPNDGTLGDAGGETDVSVTFDIDIN
ncbi:MAG: type 1 periplasmic binding fold superfamily protein [Gilvibacter sp.]